MVVGARGSLESFDSVSTTASSPFEPAQGDNNSGVDGPWELLLSSQSVQGSLPIEFWDFGSNEDDPGLDDDFFSTSDRCALTSGTGKAEMNKGTPATADTEETLANTDAKRRGRKSLFAIVPTLPKDVETPTAQIVHVFAFCKVCAEPDEIDLRTLAVSLRSCEYDPRKNPAAVIRLEDPVGTALVHRVGSVTIMGCRNRREARGTAARVARLCVVSTACVRARVSEFRVTSLTATVDCDSPIRLEDFANDERHRPYCHYNPEVSSALRFRYDPDELGGGVFNKRKATVGIHVSGKITINGLKDEDDVQAAASNMFAVLFPYLGQRTPYNTQDK